MFKKAKCLLSYKKFKPATKRSLTEVLVSRLVIESGIWLIKQIKDYFLDS